MIVYCGFVLTEFISTNPIPSLSDHNPSHYATTLHHITTLHCPSHHTTSHHITLKATTFQRPTSVLGSVLGGLQLVRDVFHSEGMRGQ